MILERINIVKIIKINLILILNQEVVIDIPILKAIIQGQDLSQDHILIIMINKIKIINLTIIILKIIIII